MGAKQGRWLAFDFERSVHTAMSCNEVSPVVEGVVATGDEPQQNGNGGDSSSSAVTFAQTSEFQVKRMENGVHAHQLVQKRAKQETTMYERTYPIGSAFSFPVGTTTHTETEPAVIKVGKGTKLILNTVTPSFDLHNQVGKKGGGFFAKLLFGSEDNEDMLHLCTVSDTLNAVVTNIGIEVCGPRTIILDARGYVGHTVNVFGSVTESI